MESLLHDNINFIDENHIYAFARALSWEYDTDKSASATSLDFLRDDDPQRDANLIGNSTELNQEIQSLIPQKISSKSDWTPVHTRLKGNSKTHSIAQNEYRSSYSFVFLRWPILILTLIWISFLCYFYLFIRIYVASYEYLITWRGERKLLREKLRNSQGYDNWIENAKKLDSFLNLDTWKNEPQFYYYDYKTLEITIRRLKSLRERKKTEELVVVLHGCIKSNFAGIENLELYTQCYYGTKNIVMDYVTEAEKSLEYILDTDSISIYEKKQLFKIMSKNFGKTALCLSGGASFAYTHLGIIKALLDNDLLPNIISGTSGGGLVAALACTRTNKELKQILVPQLSEKLTACAEPFSVWFKRWWKTGARFDSVDWARKSAFFTFGSLTFQEAYKRTGRKLNISTVPADPHSPDILCNNITSPNCVIWSSLLASAAVPGVLNPVVLMMKDKHNNVVPFSFGSKWRDGSLRTDIPVEALNTYFNVKFSIVSQVNPHIALFFYAPKGSVGRPVSGRSKGFAGLRGGFIGAALEHLVKLEINKWLKLMKSLDLFPHLLNQDWSNVWLQRFSGTITLWPKIRLRDFFYILSDPTTNQLEEMIRKGEISAYPKLLFIRNRLRIERLIEEGRNLSKVKIGSSGVLNDPTFSDTSLNIGGSGEFRFYTDNTDSDSYESDEDSDAGLKYTDAEEWIFDERNNNYLFDDDSDESNDPDYIPSETENSSDDIYDEMNDNNDNEMGEYKETINDASY